MFFLFDFFVFDKRENYKLRITNYECADYLSVSIYPDIRLIDSEIRFYRKAHLIGYGSSSLHNLNKFVSIQ